jgi:hypothetical protein
MPDQILVNRARPREQRDAQLRRDQQYDDLQREPPPLAYAIHDVESFADCRGNEKAIGLELA